MENEYINNIYSEKAYYGYLKYCGIKELNLISLKALGRPYGGETHSQFFLTTKDKVVKSKGLQSLS